MNGLLSRKEEGCAVLLNEQTATALPNIKNSISRVDNQIIQETAMPNHGAVIPLYKNV